LFLADLYQHQQALVWTSDGASTSASGTVPGPMQTTGAIYDQGGTLGGSFSNGVIMGSGLLTGGSVNYLTGAISLTFSSAPANLDKIYADYIQAAPYRCAWSAIGDPTNWPTPFTNNAIAVQSGINDLDPERGPVMFVAGYPQYALVFQRTGITRASYIGGQVVWSWQPYEYKRGVIAHGAAIKVGATVYFLADDGLWMTDGANVAPVGTAPDNSGGIDRWLWKNLNGNALETIRAGYDASQRSLVFAIPTGSSTLPDTLLTYNTMAQRWSRSQIPVETIWTTDDGTDGSPATRQELGIIDRSHSPATLTGNPLSGYLETVDLYDASGNFRETSGAIPQVESDDIPQIVMGTRDNLASAVTYQAAESPDPFSGVAPVLCEGRYTRARVQSVSATNFQGLTLIGESRDGV
jgi:hypothetical protein